MYVALSPVAQVRYDANSEFREHGHPEGEEILVLEGSWQGNCVVRRRSLG